MIQITHPSILKKAAAIPIPFFTKYFAKKKKVNINIRMGSKLMPVRLLYYPSFRAAYISAGWQAFAVASNLKAGDVCIFELENEQDQVLDVHIYRAGHLSIL
ncbi:60S ribosomal protein L7-like 1 [Stylosanthes scabra]|uniref:60S ribosomal protein L7-like 1 n=1 Tax=Stylosanthes scabra TaxID=79078 RepID=A0ABU6XI51_9FABA|nr:60S ribosomal protein L7-like 1 [Stylosanthes scabra]